MFATTATTTRKTSMKATTTTLNSCYNEFKFLNIEYEKWKVESEYKQAYTQAHRRTFTVENVWNGLKAHSLLQTAHGTHFSCGNFAHLLCMVVYGAVKTIGSAEIMQRQAEDDSVAV